MVSLRLRTFLYQGDLFPSAGGKGRGYPFGFPDGGYDIEESVLLFATALYAPITPFVKELKAFRRVSLKKGGKKTVSFTLTEKDLTYVDRSYQRVLLHTTYRLMVEDLACEIEF